MERQSYDNDSLLPAATEEKLCFAGYAITIVSPFITLRGKVIVML